MFKFSNSEKHARSYSGCIINRSSSDDSGNHFGSLSDKGSVDDEKKKLDGRRMRCGSDGTAYSRYGHRVSGDDSHGFSGRWV